MPLTNAVPTWTLVMPQGSAQLWNFVFTEVASGDPFPISGSTWEYVVRSASGVSIRRHNIGSRTLMNRAQRRCLDDN